jgi:hypothetical protein
MKKLFLILLFATSIFAQSGRMMLLFGEESYQPLTIEEPYQPLTIVAATANYVIDNGGAAYFRVAGIAGKPFKVDWGDGTISQITFTGATTDQRITKTYVNAGTYNAKIYGWNDVTRITWNSWNAGNFNINNLPAGLTYLNLYTLGTNLIGSLDYLPAGLTYLAFYNLGTNLIGSIDNLPAGLTSLTFYNIGTNITYTSPHVWSLALDFVRLEALALDVTEVDNILCDIANSNNLTGTRTLDLQDGTGTNNNAIPSATGLNCETTLQTQGWTVLTD